MQGDWMCGNGEMKYRLLGEARTIDNGKLLFQVADNGSEAVLLLKPRGSAVLYCIALSELNFFVNARR